MCKPISGRYNANGNPLRYIDPLGTINWDKVFSGTLSIATGVLTIGAIATGALVASPVLLGVAVIGAAFAITGGLTITTLGIVDTDKANAAGEIIPTTPTGLVGLGIAAATENELSSGVAYGDMAWIAAGNINQIDITDANKLVESLTKLDEVNTLRQGTETLINNHVKQE